MFRKTLGPICMATLLTAMIACNQTREKKESSAAPEIVNDTIPLQRTNVSQAAVASFSEAVPDKDKLNDWKFSVDAFETPATFSYLLKITYKALEVEDTVKIPNIGLRPIIVLKKGEDPFSCVLGFQGKEGEFNEYKLISIEKEQLKIKTIRGYRRTLVRK